MEIELSIIIPTYNAEKSIEACMDNLITGLEKLDKTKSVEVIVVNDGSTDRTEEKLKQYIHNVYFKLINKKNGGCLQQEMPVSLSPEESIYILLMQMILFM